MSQPLLLILTLLFSLTASAQFSNVTLFTENGERFTVILNGARQNETPETQVKITDLNAANYKMKIIFEDQALGAIDKNLFLNPGNESSFSIKRNNKGVYVLRFISETPIAQLPPPAPTQRVIVYNATPQPQTVVTETTTTTVSHGTQETVNMGVNMNGVGMNVNVNINDGTGMGGVQQTTTTTYSTTTSGTVVQPAQPQHYVMPGYGGPVGCPWPMSDADFRSAKQSVANQTFSDNQLQVAKQIAGSNCLTSAQVKELMLIFSFEDTRLDLAKYCYGYTYDTGNYFKVNDAFTFSSSVDELNAYISGR